MTKRKAAPRSRSDRRDAASRPGPPRPGVDEPYWLWGAHAVEAALANPRRRCHRLLLADESAAGWQERLAPLLAARDDLPHGPERLSRTEMARFLGAQAVHQGIAVLAAPLRQPDLEALVARGLERERAAVVVLDQVSDPQNAGAVLRSAAAFGAVGVVTTKRNAPGESGALAKAASGTLESTPFVHVANLARALDRLAAAGFRVLGLAGDGEAPLQAEADAPRIALVLGAEGTGLRRLTRERCDRLVHLPTRGAIADLNVSNAAAVALYEVLGRERS